MIVGEDKNGNVAVSKSAVRSDIGRQDGAVISAKMNAKFQMKVKQIVLKI